MGSIMVRIISFEERAIDAAFWTAKIRAAHAVREALNLTQQKETTVYRLVHGEGDGLPGLIIDYYNGTAVIQAHHIGMHQHLQDITEGLRAVYGKQLKGVYDKSAETLPKAEAVPSNEWVWGKSETDLVKEYGASYKIDWEKGQKTGFFIDQRENRKLVASYSKGKKVLNTFCYSGGFSVLALQEGATEVHSVDISQKQLTSQKKTSHWTQDLKASTNPLWPMWSNTSERLGMTSTSSFGSPAFAKSLKARHNAVQAYKRLNAEALRKIKPGGILFTFSCSQVVDKRLFANTITAAALESKRNVRILHQLSQPADHPINCFHPETEYLKGLVLYVE